MSMFTLAISCLITSNFPWFMDLTFQVPMQYCSLQHQILLLSPVPSTTGCCFCFGFKPSFFLELFLQWSPVAYWASTDLVVHLSMSYLLPFHTVHGFLEARILLWFAIPFSKLPTSAGSLKKQESSRKHLFLLYWLCQSLWQCGSQQTLENSERDGNTRPPHLPLEKPAYRSGSNS